MFVSSVITVICMNVGDPWDDEFELMNSIALLSYPVHVHSHLRPLMARVGACGPDNLGGLSQQTATSTGSAIIILPRIDSGHGEQDRRLIRPAPPKGQ